MPDELRALSRVAFEEVRDGPGGIGEIHGAIANRAFRRPGVTRTVHDAISRAVYTGVGGAFGLAGRAVDGALARRSASEERTLSTKPAGAAVIAVLNGLRGDVLEQRGSELAEPVSVRAKGAVVRPSEIAAAFPEATGWPVVFVHGLFETEFAWRFGGREPYGARLARDLGCTPVFVRYNTGRHISENGRSLADLLEAVVGAWPVEVEKLALVGHSMGGLVARSACHGAAERGDEWVQKVRHIVSLGSPNAGAPLEQAVHLLSAGLAALPETKPFAGFLRRRSSGIRDMRGGSLVDEDWRDRDPDALRAAACQEVPLLENATHCFVAATVTRSKAHPVGRMIGDWLVLEPSASYKTEHAMHVGGVHHLALLNHPDVYACLRERLATDPPGV
jgi:pimeloyl-ACP methyl ester carboxylesterase